MSHVPPPPPTLRTKKVPTSKPQEEKKNARSGDGCGGKKSSKTIPVAATSSKVVAKQRSGNKKNSAGTAVGAVSESGRPGIPGLASSMMASATTNTRARVSPSTNFPESSLVPTEKSKTPAAATCESDLSPSEENAADGAVDCHALVAATVAADIVATTLGAALVATTQSQREDGSSVPAGAPVFAPAHPAPTTSTSSVSSTPAPTTSTSSASSTPAPRRSFSVVSSGSAPSALLLELGGAARLAEDFGITCRRCLKSRSKKYTCPSEVRKGKVCARISKSSTAGRIVFFWKHGEWRFSFRPG